ncbi:dihydrofolate reductase family protein [Kineococcus indalonis]|uniref:dihydrofolate reductase family protein n=1 Tax=Kineococcus indalonis TaxID=2696566 RepID=UPI001412505E|nr:dihydrofolate reductase family protein [Kineococcus indalonis]NAZ88487.1 dihydrofolate reductase [Kineococcus indalonis]
MRIVVSEFTSLDGVVQAPGGPEEDTDGGFAHGGWSMPHFDPEAMGGAIDALMGETEALLFGARTWRTMAGAWPERSGDGDAFTDRINTVPKHVASRSLTPADMTWQGSVLLPADDAIGAVRGLRERGGAGSGAVLQVMGSAHLATQLAEQDLVDEYLLMLEPVLLGGGKRVFPGDGRARPLELVSATTTGTGVLVCRYRRAR